MTPIQHCKPYAIPQRAQAGLHRPAAMTPGIFQQVAHQAPQQAFITRYGQWKQGHACCWPW